MRVNLTVQRHKLEPVNILWLITPPTNQTSANTISRFLSDINERFPLESDDWGLEDYTVSVGGFECVHYHNVTDVLRDGDHVIIQPLESVDIRSRTLSGRSQISAAGITLIDGVPFGKATLRTVDRPRVYIPPRKRRRIGDEEDAPRQIAAREGTSVSLSDIDRDEEQLLLLNGGEASLLEEETLSVPRTRERTRKSVSFGLEAPLAMEAGSDDEDEDDDDDFDPDDVMEGSDSDESSVDGVEAQTIVDNRAGAEASAASSTNIKKPIDISSASDSSDSSPVSSSDTSSDESSDSEMEGAQVAKKTPSKLTSVSTTAAGNTPYKQPTMALSSKDQMSVHINGLNASPLTVAPGLGTKRTQNRNQRRKDSKALKRLKANGDMPEDAVIADLRMSDKGWTSSTTNNGASTKIANGTQLSVPPEGTVPAGIFNPDFDRPDYLFAEVILENEETPFEPAGKSDEFLKRRQKLLDELASGAVFVDAGSSQHSEKKIRKQAADILVAETTSEPSPKRARLDLNASRRMIFGMLGTRAPKTRAEAELTRQKLIDKSSRVKKRIEQVDETESAPEAVDPESQDWRSLLSVRAVECVQEGVILSEPPYPFVQRWDPQQKLPRNRGKSKKRKQAELEEYNEEFDELDPFEEGDTTLGHSALDGVDESGLENYEDTDAQLELDYGEPVANNIPIATQVFHEQAEEQLMSDVQSSAATNAAVEDEEMDLEEDDFTTYPQAKPADLLPGAYIAFKQLECTAATYWSPQISDFRVAQILKEDDLDKGAVALRIDEEYIHRPRVRYDENGKRIYTKFEMPRQEMGLEDEEDDGFRILEFEELLECKLLEAAVEEKPVDGKTTTESTTLKPDVVATKLQAETKTNGKDMSSTSLRHSNSASEWNGIEDALTDEALLASETGDHE